VFFGLPGPSITSIPRVNHSAREFSLSQAALFLNSGPKGSLAMMTNNLTRLRNVLGIAIAALLLSALPAPAQTFNAAYGYAANLGDNTISIFKVDPATGQFSATSYLSLGNISSPSSVALVRTPTASFLYVAVNSDGSTIAEYSINPANGLLTSVGSIPVGASPTGLAVDPTNHFVYVANTADNNASAFQLDINGILTALGNTNTGNAPIAVVTVEGNTQNFAYVINQGDNTVSQFTICAAPIDCSPNGSLVTGTTTTTAGQALQAAAATPNGQFLFVADSSTAAVLPFKIDPASGALTAVPGSFVTGQNPFSVAIDPAGRFLYTANFGSRSISSFKINADGTLTSLGVDTSLLGQQPSQVLVDPNGQFLYVFDQGSNLQETYVIGPAGGLGFLSSSTARIGPSSFAVTQSIAHTIGNEYFYATNTNSTTISGAPLDLQTGDVGTVTSTPSLQALPVPIIADLTGQHVFVTNGTASNAFLTEFTITPSTGALINSIPAQGAIRLVDLGNAEALDPSGRFLYVADGNGNVVYLCPVASGVLTGPCSTGIAVIDPVGLATAPSGQFLFVLGTDGNGNFVVNVYTIDPNSGALAAVANSPFPTLNSGAAQNSNQQIVVHPSGNYVIVTNGTSNAFTIFSLEATTGVLTKAQGDILVQGIPLALLFDAPGNNLYEVEGNSNLINSYAFNPKTGATALSGTAPVGNIIGSAAAIDMTGQFFLQPATANDANITGSVAVYPIDPANGALGEALSVTTLGNLTTSIVAVGVNITAGFPSVTLIPNQANFPNTALNSPASPIPVTVHNFGTAPLIFTSITIAAGANPGDFTLDSGTTCSTQTPVPAAGTCILSIIFTPTAAGNRTASLTLVDNANPATQSLPLFGTGTGSAPSVTLIPDAADFPNTPINTTSAAIPVTLHNFGTAPLLFTSIALNAGANPGDFTLGPLTTCSIQTPVAAGGTCILSIIFTPGAAGPRSATLTLADNATPATQTLPLTGTGTASTGPVVGLNPTAATFPSTPLNTPSGAVAVKVTNSGQSPLTFTSIAIGPVTSVPDFTLASASTCTTQAPVAPNTSCTLSIVFTPSAAGARTGTLTLSDNAVPATQTIALAGTGAAGGGDFTITIPEGPPIVIIAGQPTTVVANVVPGPGTQIPITFNAPGPLPAGLCVFYPQPNPTTVTTPQSFTFRITTTPKTGAIGPGTRPPINIRPPVLPQPLQFLALVFAILCALGRAAAFSLGKLRARRIAAFAAIALLLATAGTFFAGCGGGSSNDAPISLNTTPPGTYQIVITATAGTTVHSVTAIIQVQ
jgi:6-phosphogluconolactonase (cycloisomerase 2 family)